MATEGTGVSGLAQRYATALFELADEQKALDQTAKDLTLLKQLLAESADLRRVVASPLIARADQARAIDAVLAQTGVSDLVRRFTGLTAQKRRLFVLPGVIEAFLAELARRRGEETAIVIAAQPLSPAQQDELSDTLKRTMGSKVTVDVRVDPALIGGMIVKVGSRMIDASVRTKLTKLKLAMKGVG
ncbi:F0F1 ATP synthase subunit delta [Indioceanicola profundi]|uniref:F0F1 ATP synthase subunit delta n=1 Tax=Indioceanicola profundi TaxID=2220096 RepID=UPI000E6AAA1C|nr:F0F1 ATP synthase subunit delta [Indioceanicola profundi]